MSTLERLGVVVLAVLCLVIAGVYGAAWTAGAAPLPTSALMLVSAIGGLLVVKWSSRRKG